MNKNKEELIKLIQENPNLPIRFMIHEECCDGEHTWLMVDRYRVEKTKIWQYDEQVYTDYDLAFDDMSSDLADEEEYADLWEDEFDKVVEKEMEKIEQEVILIYIEP